MARVNVLTRTVDPAMAQGADAVSFAAGLSLFFCVFEYILFGNEAGVNPHLAFCPKVHGLKQGQLDIHGVKGGPYP